MRTAVAVLAGASVVLVPMGVHAANPKCPTYFTTAVVHTVGDHVRGKACFRDSTDNWQFQDTYADGMGVNLRIPYDGNPGTAARWINDSDGSNNGWIVVYSDYVDNKTIFPAVCSIDFETGNNYGCTVRTMLS